jgi:hypothetical protein
MDSLCSITHDQETIRVGNDVTASWLCRRFELPADSVLGVILPGGIEVDLTDRKNVVSRSMLSGQSNLTLLLTGKAKHLALEKRKLEALERFLHTGFWPSAVLIHMILARFHLPLDLRKIIVEKSTPELKEEKIHSHNINTGYQNQGPTSPSLVTFQFPIQINRMRTYHYWLDTPPNKLDPPANLSLRNIKSEITYGPWTISSLQEDMVAENRPYYLWLIKPDEGKDYFIMLPAGTYEIVDSHQASWSTNAGAGNAGYYEIWGTLLKIDDPRVWSL